LSGCKLTERLYYDDAYLTTFHARVIAREDNGRRLYLDRTAFYPDSGGQPSDLGTINGAAVSDIVDENDRVAHILAEPIAVDDIDGAIDWPRRFDHMQQHTGQHLLSAVIEALFAFKTVSFHLGAVASTIDLATASLSVQQLLEIEARANSVVTENRPVRISYEHAQEAAGLRKASERAGTLRIVSIDGLDRSACGGTHVRATGEIGAVLMRKLEKIRGNVRLEFLCGLRALRRARGDYDALGRVAQVYSCALDEAPQLAAAQQAALVASEKARLKLAAELANLRGHDLYAGVAPQPNGLRVYEARVAGIDDEIRQQAQGYIANPKAAFLAYAPAAILLATSADAGIHAGNALKRLLLEVNGRGGGSAQIAQGSVPDTAALDQVVTDLRALIASAPPERS
jgi:alanyl-tRNA synthetase